MAQEPNQGATGDVAAEDAPPTVGAPDAHASPDPPPAGAAAINQGATGSRPMGESPLSVQSESDPFAERPEAFVGGAFAGGFALALILRRLTR